MRIFPWKVVFMRMTVAFGLFLPNRVELPHTAWSKRDFVVEVVIVDFPVLNHIL
jgi:hypothetical protein